MAQQDQHRHRENHLPSFSSSSPYSPPPPTSAALIAYPLPLPFQPSQAPNQLQQQQRSHYPIPPPTQYSPLPPPSSFSSSNSTSSIEFPKRGPSITPSSVHTSNFSTTSTTPTTPSIAHNTSIEREFTLEPPQRNFATFDRIRTSTSSSSTDRPDSVVSFSNISTNSNEPLYTTSARPSQTRKLLSARKISSSHSNRHRQPSQQAKQDQPYREMMQTARSLTPQPWHPDYHNRNSSCSATPNPLDLPEHRNRGTHEFESGLSEIDLSDNHPDREKKNHYKNDNSLSNGGVPVLNKTRKNIFTRLTRKRTKVTYEVAGTGRLAQFSNERLYLHWIRFGILQGSIAMTLLSFGYGVAAYVGVGALMLSLATLIYATTLYHLRHIYMITKRNDIEYYQRVIPTLLCFGLILLYTANFALTMSIGEDARSPPPWAKDDNFGHYF